MWFLCRFAVYKILLLRISAHCYELRTAVDSANRVQDSAQKTPRHLNVHRSCDLEIMAMEHVREHVYGIQWHPEARRTPTSDARCVEIYKSTET